MLAKNHVSKCHLTESEIEELVNIFQISSKENARLEIESAYLNSQDPNSLARLLWDCRNSYFLTDPKQSKIWHKSKMKQIDEIKTHSRELFNILENNADYVVEVLDNILLKEEPFQFVSDDGLDIYQGNFYISQEDLCNVLAQLISATEVMEERVKKAKRPKGRPSLHSYYNFIFQNAVLYQEITGEKFTVFRHLTNNGYEAITEGHRFSKKITDILNKYQSKRIYDNKNILNACEKAVRRLNTTTPIKSDRFG